MTQSPTSLRKVGETLESGRVIKDIIGQDERIGVFITTENKLTYELYVDNLPAHIQSSIAKTGALWYALRTSVPDKKSEYYRLQLAHAFSTALNLPEGADPLPAFSEVEKVILDVGKTFAAFRYLLGSIIAGVVLIIFALIIRRLITSNVDLIAYGAIGGTVGAMLSVLLRVRDLSVTKITQLGLAPIEGGSRTLLGFLFGIVLIITINSYACVLMAIIAGFSERFAPELLKSIEDHHSANINSSNTQKDQSSLK
jgi:hypothetical protein